LQLINQIDEPCPFCSLCPDEGCACFSTAYPSAGVDDDTDDDDTAAAPPKRKDQLGSHFVHKYKIIIFIY